MSFSIPNSTLEEIKARTDLADLISSYGVTLRRAGADFKACCPFHHEKTPSFMVHPDRGFYHCFGCGESGDALTFVQRQEGLSFQEAARKLAARCGVTLEEREDPNAALRKRLLALHAELAAFYRRCLRDSREGAAARAYLKARDLDGDVAERFQIGYAPVASSAILKWAAKYHFTPEELQAAGVLLPPKFAGGTWYNRFAGRLVFPIRDKTGRTVAFSCRTLETDKARMRGGKYVNSPETVLFKKSDVLYAFDLAAGKIRQAPRHEAIVCEGQIDVIRCHACGFATAVASQGTAFGKEHVKLLARLAESVVLVFDADGAGQKASLRTGAEFLAIGMPVRVATLPPGEDPDSLLRTQGPEAFQACLDAAESIAAFQVRVLRAQETNPDSIDAFTRVSRAVLATVAVCPSAVMRASLLGETAKLLGVPPAALEEDLVRLRAQAKSAPPAPAPAAVAPAVAVAAADAPVLPPPDDPPPVREMAFCEFLFAHERDAALGAEVRACAPEALFAHAFTRAFVAAWLRELESAADEMAALRGALPPADCRWLDRILLASERAAFTDVPPEQVLHDLLRQLWQAAVRRRQGSLAFASTEENDRLRLNYSILARKFQCGRWETIRPLMTAESLA